MINKAFILTTLIMMQSIPISAIVNPDDFPWTPIALGAAGVTVTVGIFGLLVRGKNYEAERDKQKRKLLKATDEHEQQQELKSYVKNLSIINQKYADGEINTYIAAYSHKEFNLLDLSSEFEHDLKTLYELKHLADNQERPLVEALIKKIRSMQTILNNNCKNEIVKQRKEYALQQEQKRLTQAQTAALENKAKAQLAKKECFETFRREITDFIDHSNQQLQAAHAQNTAFYTCVVQENVSLLSTMKKILKEHSLHAIQENLRSAHGKLDQIKAQQSHLAHEANRLDVIERKVHTVEQKIDYIAHALDALRSLLTAPSAPPRDF